MKRLRNEKGAITIITLVTILFIISFLITSYTVVANKVKTQKQMLNETKAIYEPKVTMEEIYNSYFTNENTIPIYTTEQLLAIGSGELINVEGKIYTFSNTANTTYLLKNDLEFSATDLGLETDWIPPYKNTDFLGNFDWNGQMIEVTTLSGNTIAYNGRFEDTVTGNPITLAYSTGDNVIDYKIYGNSVQNGTPTPTTPVEIQSVGDKTINLFNPKGEVESVGAYLGINTTGMNTDYTLYIKLKEGKTVPEGVYFGFVYYHTEDSEGASASWIISKGTLNQSYGDGQTYALTRFNPSQYYLTGICCYGATQEKWDSIIDAFDIFWVEGSYYSNNIPEYEPYGKYKIPIKVSGNNVEMQIYNIYLDEPLRKVGTYADYIDFENGKIIREIAYEQIDSKYTLDVLSASTTDDTIIAMLNSTSPYSKSKLEQKVGYLTIGKVCDYSHSLKDTGTVYWAYNANETTFFGVPTSVLTSLNFTSDIQGIRKFIDYQNSIDPIMLQYILKTPTEEPIELPDLPTFKGITTIEVNTEIKPSNISVTYNGKQ